MASGSRTKPKAKRTLAQKRQTANAQAHSNHQLAQPSRRRQTKLELQKELHATQQNLLSTTQNLNDTKKKLSVTSEKLAEAHLFITTARLNYSTLFKQKADIYQLLRTERRKSQRYAVAKLELQRKLKEQSLSLARTEQELVATTQERERAIEAERQFRLRITTLLSQSDSELARVKLLLSDSRRKIRAVEAKNLRSVRSRNKAVEKAKKAGQKHVNKWTLVEKGAYTPLAKSIIRTVAKSGCSQGKVGAVLKAVAQAAGLSVKGKAPSRRTVQRTLMEGGVAARIQLAYEMADADGVTLSSDATSVRGENYEGAHVMINKGSTHKMRILSMTSTVSHSSETQLANLKHQISTISDLYRRSPLGQRSAFNFEVHDFLRVWKGGNGDHAPDVKKFFRLGAAWKRESSRILLGYEEFQRMEPQKLVDIVRDILKGNLQEVGGLEEWAKLSDEQKNIMTKSSMDALAFRLGEEVFEQLPPEAKHDIELFFWAGCSMHKELNCCKAFDDGMKQFYEDHPELDQPVLLANKDNDATIQLAEDTGESTAAVRRALKVSERGGVKLISLFGALVNHKDDKKGLHDIYENYFRPTIGPGVRFPDTNNTRYQSHGRGGARIITYLDEHREFMQFVKDNKQKRTLNHLEENIVKGLHCPQTISQIVALVLFTMAAMHPYALQVRGPGTENLNMLNLGPLHSSVKNHLKKLIADPSSLFSSSSDSYKTATLDGKPWSDMKAWAACVKILPTLPDVRPLMLAGLKSALERFERFTTEFDQGGLIDTSTEAERLAANMPSTNDANEGLLGTWRKFSRESSSSTVGHFTDIAMFHRNDTQNFIDMHMNSTEDHQFLRQEARRIDESGVEKARRVELNANKQQAVDEKRAKDAERAEKARKEKERLEVIGIETRRSEIAKMSDPKLKDQLELHRRGGDKEIPLKSHLKNKAQRLEELLAAMDRFDARIATLSTVPLPQ